MEFSLSRAILILERTPDVLNTLLENLPQEWTQNNEGENTWSPYDVVGHLIHGEKTDWVVRTEIILNNSADKTFEPYDRFAQFKNSKGKTLKELLEEFHELRSANIQKLNSFGITEEDLKREGIHPAFEGVTLRQLLAAWVVHDLGHIAQIARVMAKQYKSEAGPWVEYLGILQN